MYSPITRPSAMLKVAATAVFTVQLACAPVQAQAPADAPSTQVSDAQVEANVLRALAAAPELSTQNIQSTTVYGTVTLAGNVHDEALRVQAENLVARAPGVKKVVDQLTLGDTPAPSPDTQNAADFTNAPAVGTPAPGPGMVLQSDGTYAPASAADSQQPAQSYNQPPNYDPQGPQGPPPAGRQPLAPGGSYPYQPPAGVAPGQQAGIPVVIPAGAVVSIRINRGLDSQHVQPGALFDGTVMTDIVSNGTVAIPRGASVQGNVVDAKKAGVFKGEGTIALQLNTLTLGGNVYPLATQVWVRSGKDKTAGTVNRTAGTAAFGAILGALAGGGEGAAIGAGVGGAAGLASSAGGPRGQVLIAPESMLSFTTAQPTPVRTVSQAEMARLAYAAGPGQPPRPPMRRYYSPYYGYYYAPAY